MRATETPKTPKQASPRHKRLEAPKNCLQPHNPKRNRPSDAASDD